MALHTNHATCTSIPAQGYLLLPLLGRLLHEELVQINIDIPCQLHITVTRGNHVTLGWINMGSSQLERTRNLQFTGALLHPGRERDVAPWQKRSLMVRWIVGSIRHGVDPLSYFSFQPVLHDWCNKGRGMCYPVCGMMHIKEPLLLIRKSSPCGDSGFPLSLT